MTGCLKMLKYLKKFFFKPPMSRIKDEDMIETLMEFREQCGIDFSIKSFVGKPYMFIFKKKTYHYNVSFKAGMEWLLTRYAYAIAAPIVDDVASEIVHTMPDHSQN